MKGERFNAAKPFLGREQNHGGCLLLSEHNGHFARDR